MLECDVIRKFNVQNSNHCVPLQIMRQSLLEDYIRLVNQHDRLLRSSDVEDHLKGAVQISMRHSQVPLTNDVPTTLNMLVRR
jgi:hypothetical protein